MPNAAGGPNYLRDVVVGLPHAVGVLDPLLADVGQLRRGVAVERSAVVGVTEPLGSRAPDEPPEIHLRIALQVRCQHLDPAWGIGRLQAVDGGARVPGPVPDVRGAAADVLVVLGPLTH